ncbi:MAG: DUF4168 domain-containing protein [Pararhodobacter sp.]
MPIRKTLAATATALGLALAAPLALPALADQPAAQSIDQQQLEAFVNAFQAVNEVEARHAAAFEAAETDDARAQVVAQANAEMVDAIEATAGISVEQYIEVLQQAQVDADLNARIAAMIEG